MEEPSGRKPYAEQPGPVCAQHPAEHAEAICARCGGYMCAYCHRGGTYRTCEPCRRHTGEEHFPIDRATFDLGRVWHVVKRRFGTQWPILTIAIVIFLGVNVAINIAQQILMLPMAEVFEGGTGASPAGLGFMMMVMLGIIMIEAAITGTIMVGVSRVYLDVLMGRPASISRLFGQLRKMGKVVIQFLVTIVALGIPVTLWTMLIVAAAVAGSSLGMKLFLAGLVFIAGAVPLTYFTLPFFFMLTELALGRHTGPVEAIMNAAKVLRGKRLIALVAVLAYGALVFIGLLVCLVGVIPAMALGQLFLVAVYLGLRNGSELPSPTEELEQPFQQT